MRDFHVLVVTSREVVPAFVTSLSDRAPGIRVTAIAPTTLAVDTAADSLDAASVAVVDASVDADAALTIVHELRRRRASLPIGVLFCCAYAAHAQRLGEFVAAGAGGLFDFRLSAEEMLGALRCLAGGRGLFHLQLPQGSSTALSDSFDASRAADLSDHDWCLLSLVKLGLTDYEIGREMYLSPHTVKHRIEKLRRRAQARNRVQLAAWAAEEKARRPARDHGALAGSAT